MPLNRQELIKIGTRVLHESFLDGPEQINVQAFLAQPPDRYDLEEISAQARNMASKASLGLATIIERGVEASPEDLPWLVWANYIGQGYDGEEISIRKISQLTGISPPALQKLKNYPHQVYNESTWEVFLKSIDLYTAMKSPQRYAEDFLATKKQGAKDVPFSITFTETADNQFATFGYSRTVMGAYLDTPAALCVAKNNTGVAILGIAPKDKDTLFVRQIQGINNANGSDHGLSNYEWRHGLVRVAESIGKTAGFRHVAIQSAQNNRWTKERHKDGTLHMTMDKAIQIYDVTAISLGYKKDSDENFYKQV